MISSGRNDIVNYRTYVPFHFVSVGKIRQDIVDSIVKRFPEFADRLSSDTDILFWRDRIRHTERHRKDF